MKTKTIVLFFLVAILSFINSEVSLALHSTRKHKVTNAQHSTRKHKVTKKTKTIVEIPYDCEVIHINWDNTGYNIGCEKGYWDGHRILNRNKEEIGTCELSSDESMLTVKDNEGVVKGYTSYPANGYNKVYSIENNRDVYIVKSYDYLCLIGALARLLYTK